jgi:hypothetical protein
MMQDDDRLSTRLTCGVEGSCTTTKDVEGEVWMIRGSNFAQKFKVLRIASN